MSTSFFFMYSVCCCVYLVCWIDDAFFVELVLSHANTHTQKEIKTFKMFILRVSIVFRLDDALPKKTFIFVHFCIFFKNKFNFEY
jgi:hypothetical protein